MTKGDLLRMAQEACNIYSDIDMTVLSCCYLYCEDNEFPEELAEDMEAAYMAAHEENFNYNPRYEDDLKKGLEVKNLGLRRELTGK